MFISPRQLLACGTALLALGAGSAPALAATTTTTGHTPAAQAILTLPPKPGFKAGCGTTAASERSNRARMLTNANTWTHIASVVSHARASSTQQKGRGTWVDGARTLIAADREYAYGAKLLLDGDSAAGNQKCNAAYVPLMKGDVLLVNGEKQMGIYRFESPTS